MRHRRKSRTRLNATAQPASGKTAATEPDKPAAVTQTPAPGARAAVAVVDDGSVALVHGQDDQVAAGEVGTPAGAHMLGGPLCSLYGQGAQLLEDFAAPVGDASPSGEGSCQASGANADPAGVSADASTDTDGVPSVAECFLAGLEAAAGDPAPALTIVQRFQHFLSGGLLGADIGSAPARPLSPHAYLANVAAHLRNLSTFLELLEGATMARLPDEIRDEIWRDMIPKMKATMAGMETALRAVPSASLEVLGGLLSAVAEGAEALGLGMEVLQRALGIAQQAQA